MIWLGTLLIASIALNFLLIWYARRLTTQFLFFTENVRELEFSLRRFDNHLKSVHELEMFYGDDTLTGLIEHSKDIVKDVGAFYDGFSLEEEEDEGGEE